MLCGFHHCCFSDSLLLFVHALERQCQTLLLTASTLLQGINPRSSAQWSYVSGHTEMVHIICKIILKWTWPGLFVQRFLTNSQNS